MQVLIAPAQCPYLTFKPHDSKASEFKHTENEMPGKEQVEQLVNSELGACLAKEAFPDRNVIFHLHCIILT